MGAAEIAQKTAVITSDKRTMNVSSAKVSPKNIISGRIRTRQMIPPAVPMAQP